MARDQIDMTPIASRDELVACLEAGCKPRSAFRIGTEHEKFGFRSPIISPVPYEGRRGIRALLEGLREVRLGADHRGRHIIGAEATAAARSRSSPAGNSSSPARRSRICIRPARKLTAASLAGRDDRGAARHRLSRPRLVAQMERARNPDHAQGPLQDHAQLHAARSAGTGLDMMFRTCTVQTNLDFASEADMVKKMRVGLALQPIATALFANSPFTRASPTASSPIAREIWRDTDPDRTGMLPLAFEDGHRLRALRRLCARCADVFRLARRANTSMSRGNSFRDFMQGRLAALPGEQPTMSDWANHLSTIFPEVRLKRYLEMRGADGGPWRRLRAARVLGRPSL